MQFVVATFYHFFDFPDFEQRRDEIRAKMSQWEIKGSVLVTPEGLNSTIAGKREAIDAFLGYLEADIAKEKIEHKESFCEFQPFSKGKARLKPETISVGEPLSLAQRGKYVEAKDWNALIADPDTIVLDTRNNYEVHLGTFENAINPDVRTFKKLPAFVREQLGNAKHKKIATFCTGGIRCEKFTSWLLKEGFEDVYHLKGGILKYLEEVPQEESKWQGECYVFDDRVAVDHSLAASQTASLCAKCDRTLNAEEQVHPDYVKGQQCQHCVME